jgi:glycosyltransferase involved in cell wall biosynthesis
MRIAFDGTTLTPGRTGVGYYTEHLLRHLAEVAAGTGDEVVVVSNEPIQTTRPLPAHVRVYDRWRFPIRLGWLQLLARRVLRDVGADVVHFTNGIMPIGCPVPAVVTVHDLSLRLHPRCHPWRRRLINRPLAALAIRQAAALVTVSRSTRTDLMRLHRVRPDRVHVVHEAAAPLFERVTESTKLEDVRHRYGLPGRFLLYVGTIEPRKNLPRLMEALAGVRSRGVGLDLVCVGPYGWSSRGLADQIARLNLQRAVHFTGYVPAEDLPALYSLADFFAFPSLYEGFGLPVIEAMACGTPVITSATSSLVEIAEGAAELVNPFDTAELAAALERLAVDDAHRSRLGELGRRRARAFSWTESATAMLGVYRQAAGLAPHAAREHAVVDSPVATESRVL